ncbi:MAG: Flp family type IVb pilin [Sphingomonadales bacterium]|nr:Flp family type IVb pilin [Sphingomonadales bacterium]
MNDTNQTPRRGVFSFVRSLIRDSEGATAIEYGLIAALIAVAAITAMNGLGNQLKTTFNTTASAMSAAQPAAA